jgi:hypothetical protein
MNNIIRLLALVLTLASPIGWAQTSNYLVTGGTVTSVAAVPNDATAFSMTVSGGAGPRANTGITFYQSSMPGGDANSLQRSYATALLAFTRGNLINVASFTDSSCASAVMILIT